MVCLFLWRPVRSSHFWEHSEGLGPMPAFVQGLHPQRGRGRPAPVGGSLWVGQTEGTLPGNELFPLGKAPQAETTLARLLPIVFPSKLKFSVTVLDLGERGQRLRGRSTPVQHHRAPCS